MSTQAIHAYDGDTARVRRPSPPERRLTGRRLAEMNLDPPEGPVPANVLAYFERAVERERRHR